MKIAKRFIVKGNVQGVGFRYFTNIIADRIGVDGYVSNLYNGDVEVYAIGTEDQLLELKTNLQEGPSYSRVEEVTDERVPIDSNYSGFFIEN
jgi:acylphosphatase